MTHHHHNHNQRHRRILSFPAVHPCEAISPATLLSSLITLSQSICSFQPSSFPTQKRNARETLRQLNITLLFLHEIHNRRLILPPRSITTLCFSELHFTLQKILFLMQDCAREGARLFMLTKSNHVASQFRSLVRASATVLDVLPLREIDVCDEVKELMELITKQARKARMEHDRNDESEREKVVSVLRQFDRGIEPDVDTMQGILNYLGIKTWADCNKEIKFLEDEIALDCDEREVPLLSSLVGFMSYARVVIFETLDFVVSNTDQSSSSSRCSTEMLTCINPEDFRCPISLELMTDPVTVSTGQTYDRVSITKWLKAGNKICPKTGERLTNTDLVPNNALKKLIDQFCIDNGVSVSKSCNCGRDVRRTIAPGSSAAAHATQFLSWFITRRLVFGTDEQRNKAAYEIRVLGRWNIFNRGCLIGVGTVPPLLDLLGSNDKFTQENAISALLKLSKHPKGPENIMESGGLVPILRALKKGLTLEVRQIAAATIFYLSSVKEYRKVIGEKQEVIHGLVELVMEGTSYGKKNAVVAIFGLLLHPRNHQRVIASGVIPALIAILASSEKDEVITECLAVLAVLAENVDGANAILKVTNSLWLITGMLQSAASRAGKEHCASILLSLCVKAGAEVVSVLVKDTSLMPLLYSLLTDGTSHAEKKARFLIKVLHDFTETKAIEGFLCST
ncbi:hypothetical protein RIF29_06949 [Crotalaria pallida]|uniref:RING-type E3 ubiquitin transferase n=1 Tax=Crotalaria pallida TaxID=3830 RepID=A0AAN9J3P6_CROPI